MPLAAKLGMGIIFIAWTTSALLPGRQTVPAVKAATGFVTGVLGTAMGTAKAANPNP
jgi:hypothetical protein